MKKLFLSALVVSTLAFTSCIEDDDTPIVIETQTIYNNGGGNGNGGDSCPTVAVTGFISENTTWTNDNIYILNQKVVVPNGVTLTINPGTIIKGSEGTGSLSSALIVARGGRLVAEGTSDKPIIFTSIQDNITCGQTEGNSLQNDTNSLWGGIIVLGRASCSFSGDVTEAQIEGIPADDTFGLYGPGDQPVNDSEDSGILRYISIRHGGTDIGLGNEINGLTLGGVGNGTVIDNIEVVANFDDGIEFFGGTVNATNLLVWGQGDDALDIDQAYSGNINGAMVILTEASDHALEIDGPEGTAVGSFGLENVTLIGNLDTPDGEYADYRSGAMGETKNVYAYGFKPSSDIELDNDGVATNYNDGLLTFGTWEIVLPTGVATSAELFVNKAENVTVTGFGSTSSAVTQGSQTVGATATNFNWTFAKSKGAF